MLIGVTGYAQHGKDTLASGLVLGHGFTQVALADGVREFALAIDPYVCEGTERVGNDSVWRPARLSDLVHDLGWEGAKHEPEVRRLLQKIGTEGGREVIGHAVWIAAVVNRLERMGHPEHVVVSDVRFLNEARWVSEAGGYVVGVQRVNADGTPFDNGIGTDHASEREIADVLALADTILVNDGTDAFKVLVEALPHWLTDIMPTLDRKFEEEPTTAYEVVADEIRRAYE